MLTCSTDGRDLGWGQGIDGTCRENQCRLFAREPDPQSRTQHEDRELQSVRALLEDFLIPGWGRSMFHAQPSAVVLVPHAKACEEGYKEATAGASVAEQSGCALGGWRNRSLVPLRCLAHSSLRPQHQVSPAKLKKR